MKQKIGIHLSYWQEMWSDNLSNLFGKAKEAGFDVGELPLLNPKGLDFYYLRDQLEENQLLASCGTGLNPKIDITSADYKIRDMGFDHLKACLQGAAILGSPVLGGLTYAPWGIYSDVDRSIRRAQCIDSLKYIGDYAGNLNIRLCLEVVNRFEGDLINTVEQGLSILSAVNHPSLFLHLDTFHMNIEEDDIPKAIILAGDYLGHFHAVANNRKAPGRGHLPWHQIKNALQAINYSGFIIAEIFVNPVGEVGSGMYIWRELASNIDQTAHETARFLREEVAFDV